MRIITYIFLMLALFLSSDSIAQEDEYKKFEIARFERTLLKIEVGTREWRFTFYFDENQQETVIYDASEIKQREGLVTAGDEIQMSDEGIKSPYLEIASDEIGEILVDAAEAPYVTAVSFMAVEPDKRPFRFRRTRDRLSYWNSVVVEEGEFVRGSAVAFFGDLDIYGEVNGDALAIFGDIVIGKEAVVRGDVISVNGNIRLSSGSSVYGAVVTAEGEKSLRRHRAKRWKRLETELKVAGDLYYNRVDGLGLMAGVKYQDPDSLLPSFETIGGYAFSSKRWRYKLSLIQTIIRGKISVQAGGRFYRLLKSDDDKLITQAENTLFALVFNEDWKDYFEAEGGYGFIRAGFGKWNRLEFGYLAETQNWLNAHPKLWSLFGAKEFRGNFSSVSYDSLAVHRSDFDDKLLTSLKLQLVIDTRDNDRNPRKGWYGTVVHEYSPGDWKGDFDFERSEITVTRYQPLRRYIQVNLAAAYGRVKGDLIPLNRQFFLGGLGTLYGYRHKEYRGNEYLMISTEYGFRIPHTDIRPFIEYNGGKIGADKFGSEDSWKSSVSAGVYLEENLRLFVSQRVDESDNDPIFYARFSAPF